MGEFDFDTDDLLDTEDMPEGEENTPIPPAAHRGNPFFIITIIIIGVVLVSAVIFGMRLFRDKQKDIPGAQLASAISTEIQEQTKEFVSIAKKPKKVKYDKLFDLLPPGQAADVLRELSIADIAFRTDQRGNNYTVFVDREKLDEARNILAVRGLPAVGIKGYELLDDAQTLGVTEFDKRIRFLRALSGELEKAILQFNAVESCKVQIVLPEQRLFAITQPPVTASILIRKKPGVEITDDIVFGIIKLIANAVENLQPENVSVIDTDGFVLSTGIFERMAARAEGLVPTLSVYGAVVEEEKPATPAIIAEAEGGQPIIPDFDTINEWYKVKEKFEVRLEKKVYKQLIGILPLGSFKVAITSELGPLEDGNVADVRRLSTSIVIDNNNDEIYLDQMLKKQIFSTISSSIGYIKGRDNILLTKADFRLLSDREKQELDKMIKEVTRIERFKKYFIWSLIPLGGMFIVWLVMRLLRRRKKIVKPLGYREMHKEDVREEDFSGLQEEIDTEKKVDQIKSIAVTNPAAIANVMEAWLESEQEPVPAEAGGR
ncbi:hypothetical protein ACFL96_00880 [Thermoproteota archaeon]